MLSSLRSRSRLLTATVAFCAVASPAAAEYAPSGYADASVSTSYVVVPMTFPVIGPVSYTDTYLACRSGCARKHFGQDLMGPKMNVAVAAFDGIVHSVKRESYVGEGNYLTLKGDNGWSANYVHMNNDTPGTDDGKGTAKHFVAPGITTGKRVFEGQLLGWVGDSGNAEGTAPHLHFELRKGEPWSGTVYNAYPSLRRARVLTKPAISGVHPEGVVIRGCGTCPTWLLSGAQKHLLRPEVAKEHGFDPRTAVTVTVNEARWYPRGANVPLPGGRAYRGPDGRLWFVSGGKRYAVPDAAALAPLGIAESRIRPTTDFGLATVPRTTEPLPATVFHDGALLRVPGSTTSFWLMRDGTRRLVSDAVTMKSWGLLAADAAAVPAKAELPPLGDPLPVKDGVVVVAYGLRWLVSGGTRRPFGSWAVYRSYGYGPVLQVTLPDAVAARLPAGRRLP